KALFAARPQIARGQQPFKGCERGSLKRLVHGLFSLNLTEHGSSGPTGFVFLAMSLGGARKHRATVRTDARYHNRASLRLGIDRGEILPIRYCLLGDDAIRPAVLLTIGTKLVQKTDGDQTGE